MALDRPRQPAHDNFAIECTF